MLVKQLVTGILSIGCLVVGILMLVDVISSGQTLGGILLGVGIFLGIYALTSGKKTDDDIDDTIDEQYQNNN